MRFDPRKAGLAAALLLAGCAHELTAPGFARIDAAAQRLVPITPALVQSHRQRLPVSDDVQRLFATPKPYTIGASDVLAVTVYDHPELLPNAGAVIAQAADPTGISTAPGLIVGFDGHIAFPFIGRVAVAGLTETEATELVQRRLARFVKDPQVSVRIAAFRSRRAQVDGEVRQPGAQVFTDVPMTLPEALGRAGGITPNGDRSQVLLTRGARTTAIDLLQLQEAGIAAQRILLESGDLVTVRGRDESKVFVLGEVTRPSALPMRHGRLSLNEALGEAGGPNLGTANTRQVYVVRRENDAPTVFHLDAATPAALALAESFRLQPRDVVYVDAVPLVNWNRIVSLVLPSAQAVSGVRQAVAP